MLNLESENEAASVGGRMNQSDQDFTRETYNTQQINNNQLEDDNNHI